VGSVGRFVGQVVGQGVGRTVGQGRIFLCLLAVWVGMSFSVSALSQEADSPGKGQEGQSGVVGVQVMAPQGAANTQNQAPAADDPRALYTQLDGLRVDAENVYATKEVHLRRGPLDISLGQGKLAFLAPINGQITGAVFSGDGHIVCAPRLAGERRSLAQFLNVPLLDQGFSKAYFRFTDQTNQDVLRQLQESEIHPEPDSEFVRTWSIAVSNLNPSHSVRVMFDLLSTSPKPYFSATLAGSAAGPFDALYDQRRPEQVLLGQDRIDGAYDIWASFAVPGTKREPDAATPVDYKVSTNIANDLSLEGETHLRLKESRDGERLIALELSRFLSVESVTTEDGSPITFFQNTDLSRQQVARHGNDTVVLALPEPTRAGADLQLTIRYNGKVIADTGNGVFFVGDRGSWYPHVTGGDHFVPFDLSFRWPRKLTLVATGQSTEEHDDGDFRVGHWIMPTPTSVAGFNLGEYQKQSAGSTNPKIDLYANRELDEWIAARLRANAPDSGPGEVSRSISGVLSVDPLKGLNAQTHADPKAVLRHLGAEVLDSLHFFEGINGPFPFEELSISPIPGNFGQGWPGLVYLSTLAYLPRATQQEAGLGRHEQEEITDLLPYHELAHQWWGNEVGTASYRDAWVEEGIANYLAVMYADSKRPSANVLNTWLNSFRSELLRPVPNSTQVVADAGPLDLGMRLGSSRVPRAYDVIVYDKGAWVFHMLRQMLRDPDAKTSAERNARFDALLRDVLKEYRFHALSTAELQRAVEKTMTPSMDLEGAHSMNWFFDEWVHDIGIPHYTIEFQTHPHGQQFLITGKLKQEGVPDSFTEAVPIYAAVKEGKSQLIGRVITTGPETRFRLTSPLHPSHLLIDPQNTILCTAN
jgi:hypothetical protein